MSAIDSWSKNEWDKLNSSLTTLMHNIRVAQKVFPQTITRGNDSPVPADIIDLKTGVPSSQSKSVVKIAKEFQLGDSHVQDVPGLELAMSQVMIAAQALALAEDMLLFQGARAPVPPELLPPDTDKNHL